MPLSMPIQPTRSRPAWFVFIGALLLQIPIISNPGYFAADELQWWARADVAAAMELPWIAWGDLSALQYRPLTFNLWLLLAWLCADSPLLMHAAFATIGAINATLFGIGLSSMGASRRVATVAALIFVVTPYASYTHGWTATLADLLVVQCGLLGVLFVRRAGADPGMSLFLAVLGTGGLVTAALMAKESAVVLPLLFAAAAWHSPRPRVCLVIAAIAAAIVFAYLFVRWPVLADAGNVDVAYGWSPANLLPRTLEYLLFPWLPPLFEIAPTLDKSVARLAIAMFLLLALLGSLAHANRWLPFVWLVLQVGLLAPVLVLGVAYNHYAYLATIAAVGVPALAWTRLPRYARGAVWLTVLVVCVHGIQVMLTMREVGIAERNFHEDLVAAVHEVAGRPVLVAAMDSSGRWMLKRFVEGVPGYRGTSFEAVMLIEDDRAATHRMDGSGHLRERPPSAQPGAQ